MCEEICQKQSCSIPIAEGINKLSINKESESAQSHIKRIMYTKVNFYEEI